MAIDPKSSTAIALEQATQDYKNQLLSTSRSQQERLNAISSIDRDRSTSPDAIVSDSELENPLGAATNIGISLGSKALQQVGNILSAIPTALNEFDVSRGDFTAQDLVTYRSIQEKEKLASEGQDVEYTPEEQALLQPWERQRNVDDQPYAQYASALLADSGREATTPSVAMEPKKEILDRFFSNSERLKEFNDVFSSGEELVNTAKTETAFNEAADVFNNNIGTINQGIEKLQADDLSGIEDLIEGAKDFTAEGLYTLFSNPQAVAQVTVESIPAMLTAARSIAVGTTALANQNYQQALDEFEKEYGDIPVGDERKTTQAYSALAGIVGTYSDRFLATGARLVPNQVSNVVPRAATGAVAEGITESTEEALTAYAGLQDTERLSGDEIFTAGLFGFGSGAALAGGVTSVEKVNNLRKGLETKQNVTEKVNTGTAEVNLDNSIISDDTVRESVSEASYDKASDLAKVLRNATNLQKQESTLETTKEDAALLAKNTLNIVNSRIENAEVMLDELDAMAQQEGLNETSREEIKRNQKETKQELTRLEKVRDTYSQQVENTFNAIATSPDKVNEIKSRILDIESETSSLANDADGFNQARIDKDAALLNEAAITTDQVTSEELIQASNNPNVSPQRANQLRLTAELNDTLKSTDAVHNDIVNGGKGFIGLRQYQQRIGTMLNMGSTQQAKNQLSLLGNFANHLSNKATAYQNALEQAKASPAGTRVPVEGFLKLDGSQATVDANADKLVNDISVEAQLSAQTLQNLNNQVAGFSNPELLTASTPTNTTDVNEEITTEASTDVETTEVTDTPTTEATPEAVQETTDENVVNPASSATDIELLAVHNLETDSRKDITTLDAKEELESRDYVFNDEGDVTSAPSQSGVLDELNTGAEPQSKNKTYEGADKNFLSTNQVNVVFTNTRRGLIDSIDITNTEEVALELGRDLLPSENTLLSVLGSFSSQVADSITNNLKTPAEILARRGFQHRFPFDYFSREDGTYSDELLETLGITAMEYLENNASQLNSISNTGMATLLNVDSSNFTPTSQQLSALGNAGSPYLEVVKALGRTALKNVGLKRNTDMPINIQSKIEMDLGRVIYRALEDMNVIETETFTGQQLNELGGNYTNDKAVIRSSKVNLKSLDTGFGTDSLELFGALDGFIESLTSVTKEPHKAEIGKRTSKVSNQVRRSGGQVASKKFVEGANKDADVPHYIDANMNTVFDALGDDVIAEILGEKSEEGVIKGLLPKVVGKNRTVRRDIRTFKEFRNRMLKQEGNLNAPFFYNYRFGKQLRLSAIGSDINYQTSKLHRYLTAMEPSRIDPSDNTNASYVTFKLGVAQGMGIDIDKQTLAKSLYEYEQLINDPVIDSGVTELTKLLSSQEADVSAITAAVAKGGENTHSLKSLVGLAELRLANGKPFDTTVTYEIDGITNGPFNAHIQMGLQVVNGKVTDDSIQRMAQGGLFLDGTQSYTDWISNPSNWDIYQTTAATIGQYEQELLNPNIINDEVTLLSKQRYPVLKKYVGEIVSVDEDTGDLISVTSKGRKLTKNPVTVTVYAAGEASISNKIAESIRSNILEDLQAAVESNNTQKLNEIANDIIFLTGDNSITSMSPSDFEFTPNMVKTMNKTVRETLGNMVNKAIRENFETQIENTDLVTESSNVIFFMFKAMYDKAVNDRIAELRNSGVLSSYEYLSEQQLNEVKKELIETMPVYRSYYGDVNNGIQTANFAETNQVPDEVKSLFTIGDTMKGFSLTPSYLPTYTAPAASTMAMLNIANGDATTMARATQYSTKNIGLNVFDARIAPINSVVESAFSLNRSAYEAVAEHSILETVNERFAASYKAFSNTELDSNDPSVIQLKHYAVAYFQGGKVVKGKATLFKGNSSTTFNDEQVVSMIDENMLNKYLSIVAAKNELALENNNEAKTLLKKELTFNQFEALGTGVRFNNGEVKKGVELTPEMITEAIVNSEQKLLTATQQLPETENIDTTLASIERNVSESLSTGYVNPDAETPIADFFKGRSEASVTDLRDLVSTLEIPTTTRVIYDALLANIANTGGVTVRVLRGTDNHDVVTNQGKENTELLHGYASTTDNVIYLNAEDKINTGFTTETLFHELVHIATSDALFNGLEQLRTGVDLGLTKAQLKAVRDIQKLYDDAVKRNTLPANALENIYEFVAWGLTNNQAKSELSKSKTRLRALANSVTRLVKQMLGMTDADNNALIQLLDKAFTLSTYGKRVDNSITGNPKTLPHRAEDSIKRLTLSQVYDGVARRNTVQITNEHDTHLRTVLDEAVSKVIDPALLVTTDANQGLATEDALLLNRLDPSVNDTLTVLSGLNFRMSEQERFVYGMYSHVIDSALNDFGWNTREIRRMYDHAEKNMTWEDFVDDSSVLNTPEDIEQSKALAQSRYDAVFNNAGTGVNDYLRNFLALAVTNESFRERLANLETPRLLSKSLKGDTVRETIDNVMTAIINWLNDFAITRSHESTVLGKLDTLSKNIRYKELAEKSKLAKDAERIGGFASNTLNRINNWGKERIDKALEASQKAVKERAVLNASVRLAGVLLSEERANTFAIGLDRVQSLRAQGREGFISALWSDLKGTNSGNQRIHQLLAIKNKMVDQENVHIKQHTARMVRDEFIEPLEEKDSFAMTKVLLKADVSSLLENGYDLTTIQNLIADKELLNKEITKLTAQLRQDVPQDLYYYFTNMGKSLGRYMARGEATVDGMVFNTDAIVSLHGTGKTNPNVSTAVRNRVDSLVTLQALKMTQFSDKRRVSRVMAKEAARTDNRNGAYFLMALHNRNKKDALTKNFVNAEHNFQKGYIREIVDPYRSVQVAPLEAESELKLQGYVRINRPLNADKNDPVKKPMFLYVSEYGGEISYLQSILSTANKAAKGFSVIDRFAQAGNALPNARKPEVIAQIARSKEASMGSLFTNKPKTVFNPLVPTTNKAGQVVDYRYVMSESMKDSLLRKDNRVDEVFGAMAAGITLKVNSEEINNRLIDALHEQYIEDRDSNNLDRYVLVEANSKDKQLRETWNLLPEEAKRKAKNKFGIEGVYVRNDLVNVAFGYRKWSLTDLWNPDSEYPALIKDMAVKMASSVYGNKIANYVARGERGLQEFVKEVKDIVVIKSVIVMLGNAISNTMQLPVLHGVSPIKTITDQITAFTAASEYRKNSEEIFDLQTKIDAGLGTPAMENRLVRLNQDQQRNPVKPLMDAGMLQTIIEDSDAQDSIYSYKHSLASKVSSVTSMLPDTLVEGVKQITISQGSITYDALSQATQLSDFAARFALFNHLTKNEGYTQENALTAITEAFINYDLPPHKAMQYMNDVGITWFFKYFIRIQKVILNAFRDKPARILAFLAAQNLMAIDVDSPLNSFAPSVDLGAKIGLMDGISMGTNAHPIAQFY